MCLGWLIRWMNTWIWQSSFFLKFPFIIRVLTFLNDRSSFRRNSTFITSSVSGQSVVFDAGGEVSGRKREEKWKRLLRFPIELLEATGEEEMAPWFEGERHHRTCGPRLAHRLLTNSSRTSVGTALCQSFDWLSQAFCFHRIVLKKRCTLMCSSS